MKWLIFCKFCRKVYLEFCISYQRCDDMYDLRTMAPEEIRNNEEQHEIVKDVIYYNEKSREVKLPDKQQDFHKSCGSCIKELKSGKYGVVARFFANLYDLGDGKPGGKICLLTNQYARSLLEEESSNNSKTRMKNEIEIMNSVFQAEEMERDIEERIKKKYYYKKFELTHVG